MANCSMGVLQLFAMCFLWSSASPWEGGGQSEVFTQLLQPPPTLLVQGLGGSGVLLPLNWIWDSSNLPPLTKGTWKPRLAHSFFLTPGLQPELSYPGPWLSPLFPGLKGFSDRLSTWEQCHSPFSGWEWEWLDHRRTDRMVLELSENISPQQFPPEPPVAQNPLWGLLCRTDAARSWALESSHPFLTPFHTSSASFLCLNTFLTLHTLHSSIKHGFKILPLSVSRITKVWIPHLHPKSYATECIQSLSSSVRGAK